MSHRNNIGTEEYENLLKEIRALKNENQELRQVISRQDFLISELKGTFVSSQPLSAQSSGGWFKPPVSPRFSTQPKTRSGSVQSRRSFFTARRSSNLNTIEDIDEEIIKAEELREKSYEELINNQFSPSKLARLKSIVERWDIEIEALKRKRQEMLAFGNFNY